MKERTVEQGDIIGFAGGTWAVLVLSISVVWPTAGCSNNSISHEECAKQYYGFVYKELITHTHSNHVNS